MSDNEENFAIYRTRESRGESNSKSTSQPINKPTSSWYNSNSEPNSDSDEDDNPVDIAAILALSNIKNCLRRGSFTKKSLVNFKKRYPPLIKVLITDGGDVT